MIGRHRHHLIQQLRTATPYEYVVGGLPGENGERRE